MARQSKDACAGDGSLADLLGRAGSEVAPDISIVGMGIRVPDHLTREAERALRRCRAIFTTWPLNQVGWFLSELAPRVEYIRDGYQTGRARREIYDEMIEIVVNAAQRDGPIGFVTDGNPILLDMVSGGVAALARQRGLRVEMLPAVSSLDTALVDLEHDIGTTGLQVFEASWLVMHRIVPRSDVPCLVLGINAFGTAYATIHHDIRPRALKPLRDLLLPTYGVDHEVVYVGSATWWHEKASNRRLRLGDLTEESAEPPGTTLFIPARLPPPPVDREFVAAMSDAARFNADYQPRI
ncbi:MAG: SAM-dependent methyltransferase [Chloroflexota bacterium]